MPKNVTHKNATNMYKKLKKKKKNVTMQKIKDKNMLPMHSMTAWHTLNQLRNKAVDPAKK